MPKQIAAELRYIFLRLPAEEQIHIAIERAMQTKIGAARVHKMFSAERIAQHSQWRRDHKDLLKKFNF